jgi:hypothetical protein
LISEINSGSIISSLTGMIWGGFSEKTGKWAAPGTKHGKSRVDPGKTETNGWAGLNQTAYRSGTSHPKNSKYFWVYSQENLQIQEVLMKTGLTKKQKRTSIYFTEADDFVEICTYNTDFKKRLSEFAVKYPAECRQLDDDGNGCKTFAVKKGRFGIRLTAPYSEKRRQAASELAKKNTQNLRRTTK